MTSSESHIPDKYAKIPFELNIIIEKIRNFNSSKINTPALHNTRMMVLNTGATDASSNDKSSHKQVNFCLNFN